MFEAYVSLVEKFHVETTLVIDENNTGISRVRLFVVSVIANVNVILTSIHSSAELRDLSHSNERMSKSIFN